MRWIGRWDSWLYWKRLQWGRKFNGAGIIIVEASCLSVFVEFYPMDDLTFTLNGICLTYDFRALLLTGLPAEEVARQSGWSIAAQGELTLTLGVSLFDRPFVFTPRSIITERNQAIEGALVFDWLAERSYDMPRSEVFGLNARGDDDLVYAREIDVESSPIAVLGSGVWVMGWVEIDPDLTDQVETIERASLPDRFRRALKCYRAGPQLDLGTLL